MTHDEIRTWLEEDRSEQLDRLWARANAVRRENVGDAVHLRGLIEFSNHCVRTCGYCGLNSTNRRIQRYRMTADEILDCAHAAASYGYGTVVMQSGEDYGISALWLADVICRIHRETELAITLSVGERPLDELKRWRDAGADRYLLRFETSNRDLYDRIHPPRAGQDRSDRFELLRQLREIGYETGSGVMIGIPGQTYDDLATDIEWFGRLELDMIGVGPFIPHPAGPTALLPPAEEGQVPNTEQMAYKVVALTRLLCPASNIPSTSALATLNQTEGRELGLQRGANVVMPNCTPTRYRALYDIYPAKACVDETAEQCLHCLRARIASIGRSVGEGRGDSPAYINRLATT
ncbi:MAG: [FeFe] hydrogenase H-cluster radical SAM maturase HydE [Planctomycetes bacterium]|jgi:biotin synthase|nr:[FeFe] hydrogenase H-cluster radical SAM maturase HydE [Phycisphaerae bacterium]NBB94399.1 [FeFe] hydrogenase H-cluster radical SAM maturase HydE [Planctomycetota bacterium]